MPRLLFQIAGSVVLGAVALTGCKSEETRASGPGAAAPSTSAKCAVCGMESCTMDHGNKD